MFGREQRLVSGNPSACAPMLRRAVCTRRGSLVLSRRLIGVSILALAFSVAGCWLVGDRIAERLSEEIVGGIGGGEVEVDGDSVTGGVVRVLRCPGHLAFV